MVNNSQFIQDGLSVFEVLGIEEGPKLKTNFLPLNTFRFRLLDLKSGKQNDILIPDQWHSDGPLTKIIIAITGDFSYDFDIKDLIGERCQIEIKYIKAKYSNTIYSKVVNAYDLDLDVDAVNKFYLYLDKINNFKDVE
jgi:hypothetical protein